MVIEIGEWDGPADDCDRADAFRHFQRGDVGVRRAARKRQNVKSNDFQLISQLLNNAWPIEQCPVWLKRGIAYSRSIRRNNSEVEFARRRIDQFAHGARSGPSV